MKTLIFLILGICLNVQAQDFKIIDTVHYDAEDVVADPLNYIYAYRKDHIQKIDGTGKVLFEQSLKLNGTITSVDAQQALRILIYYKDQQLVGFLDNTLSWHNEPRNLNRAGILSSTAACHSFQNNSFWVFDQDNFSLKRLDRNMKIVSETQNLSAIFDHDFYVIRMKEIQNQLYIQVEDQGLFIFDIFGTFIKKLPIETNGKFKVINQFVYYLENGKLMRYNTKDFEKESLNLPHESVKSFTLTDKKIVLVENGKIFIYKIL